MNEGDVVGVECPCCKKELYRQVLVSINPDVWGRTSDSPSIEQDSKSDFMRCAHCKRRIAFDRFMGPVGWSFRASSEQDCS